MANCRCGRAKICPLFHFSKKFERGLYGRARPPACVRAHAYKMARRLKLKKNLNYGGPQLE